MLGRCVDGHMLLGPESTPSGEPTRRRRMAGMQCLALIHQTKRRGLGQADQTVWHRKCTTTMHILWVLSEFSATSRPGVPGMFGARFYLTIATGN